MKKVFLGVLLICAILGFFIVKRHLEYKINSNDQCITVEKLNNEFEKYKDYKSIDDYEFLKKFYYEITESGKYELYLNTGNNVELISNYENLLEYDFLGIIADSTKKTEKEELLFVKNPQTGEIIFELTKNNIFLYKKMERTLYSGVSSIVVQFKCKLKYD